MPSNDDDDDDFMAHLSKGLTSIVEDYVPEPPPQPSIFANMDWDAELKKAMSQPMSDLMLDAFKASNPSTYQQGYTDPERFAEQMMGSFDLSNKTGPSIQEQRQQRKTGQFFEMYGGTVSGRYTTKGGHSYEYNRDKYLGLQSMSGRRPSVAIVDEFNEVVNASDAIEKERTKMLMQMREQYESNKAIQDKTKSPPKQTDERRKTLLDWLKGV
jgi:hypothetical protein